MSTVFEDINNFLMFDKGLLTFIRNLEGEEWMFDDNNNIDDNQDLVDTEWRFFNLNQNNVDKVR